MTRREPAPEAPAYPDDTVAELARLYRENAAWRAAARRVSDRSESTIWFGHRPGEPWHVERRGGTTWLLPGAASDPDFVFRFPPGAIRELARAGTATDEFAVRLFELMLEDDPDLHVGFRIVAPFSRLLRRGYVRLLLTAGPRVAAFAARHGVTGLRTLERLVRAARRPRPFDWERRDGPEAG